MAITKKITNPLELRDAGVKALTYVLGDANAQEFFRQWMEIPGPDLTKWLKEPDAQSDEELIAGVMRMPVGSGIAVHDEDIL